VWADILLIRLWLQVQTPGGGDVKRIDDGLPSFKALIECGVVLVHEELAMR
jgi:hypothetical protein